MHRLALCSVSLLCLALTACGGNTGNLVPPSGDASLSAPVECAPFARALTGVSLSGPAAGWWRQADGRYARGAVPEVGSLLVLRQSPRLPSGHVAVVSRVLSRREIMVTQANWVHRTIGQDQPVIDVSPHGDWSAVRVWWPPSGQMGTEVYRAFGFIRPDRPVGHDQLIAATPAAIRMAGAGP